ncbi:Dps family protein [Tenacibaculum singaporense]|uniref:Dps family protein n=1 Tax=Tenacibaculum singaporense TaxID=2358479 RepID=UPI000F6742E0|nr:DNA starvation/stationary phase protection protein [Tenacibaculum singaporense]RSC93478.1 DNA starvation/stationary phase protection protein [Tenacibaculum singaporense]
MNTNIGITNENRQAVATELIKILADEYVLFTKTKKAHWNVEGADFYDKHKLFESQFEQIDEFIDDTAERIRSLGHYAPATLKEFLELTSLTEQSRQDNNSQGYIKELLADHEIIIHHLRERINLFDDKYSDVGSSDFITGLLSQHEKMAWFLRAHLK